MSKIVIDGKNLTLDDLVNVARSDAQVVLSEDAKHLIEKSRRYVDELVQQDRVVYGITTGFGDFAKIRISKEDAETLQRNLIVSHACGMGKLLPNDAVRAMLLLRINTLAGGYSGIRLSTLEAMINMLNRGVVPAVPEKGSLGASGDLVPLAHMVLPLIGLGEAYFKGELMHGSLAMEKAEITPVVLTSKEGLALINGTQCMTAIGALALYDALNLVKLCDISATLTIEALNGITDAYIPELHALRPHKGQMDTAQNLLKILQGSERTKNSDEVRVQDAYSLRCIPQVHGASRDAIAYVSQKVDIEINSVTDNPIILTEMDAAISCGNFHGQPMALAFDFLGIAIAELANIAERRIERLVNPHLSKLAPFLTERSGLCSGFMIAQYSAAALVSENKILAHPASVDSIPSSANQEDHVSMGTIAARKAAEISRNAQRVIAIELLTAAQAISLNHRDKGKKLGLGSQAAYDLIRSVCPPMETDRELYLDFDKIGELIDSHAITKVVDEALDGKLI